MKKKNFLAPELIIVNLNEEVILSSNGNGNWDPSDGSPITPDY